MCRSAPTLPRRSVLSKRYTVSRYTPKFVFIYGLKESMAFPESIFPDAVNVQQHSVQTFSNYQLNAQFLYSSTICMLHYAPQHVSSSTLLILRKTNCITTASGIVTLCKQPYSMQVESSQPAYCTAVYRG